jgi:hypothetical protein
MSSVQQASDQQAVDSSSLSSEIDGVVTELKKAILALAKDAPADGGHIAVTQADITLQAVVTNSGGPDAKFTIFGHAIGVKGELSKADTQTIEITLKPKIADAMAFSAEDVSEKLVEAMRAIRDSVAHASTDDPPFALDTATVELNFELDKSGSIDFVVAGERKTANTHSIKLTLSST